MIDVETGAELPRGEVPLGRWRSAAPGSASFPAASWASQAVLVLKRLVQGERHDKSALNDILRDHGID